MSANLLETMSTSRHVQLAAAARLTERAGIQCATAGDGPGSDRVLVLARLLADEADHQKALARGWYPRPDRRGPPGSTIGWYFTFDAQCRRIRELRGLPYSNAGEVARAAA